MGCSLIALAKVVAAEGQPELAARLFGATEPRINPTTELDPFERADYERAVKFVRAQLGEEVFAALRAEGKAMTSEQVLAAAESGAIPTTTTREPASVPQAKVAGASPDGLTAREVEVLCLAARGLSNTEISEQLVISPRTVNTHLTSIYSKIGVTSRSAATRYAFEHHLV